MLKHMEEVFVMKFKNLVLLFIISLLCFFLSACTASKPTSSNTINSNIINSQVNESVSTDNETTMPELTNKTTVDVPIQQIYKNEQEAANFQLHMSSVDDSLKGVGDENTSNDNN